MASKTLNSLQASNPEKIQEIEDDRYNENGWWIHLKDGWINTMDGVHSIHEDTIKECLGIFRLFVKPCESDCECKGGSRNDSKK